MNNYAHSSSSSSTAQSQFLRNNATSKPLKGIDGVYVINLDRRPDRLARFKNSSGFKDDEFCRLSAYDSTSIKWTPEILTLFQHNVFNSIATIAACALSHLQLWRHIATTKDEMHLVFEDGEEVDF